MTTKDDGGPAYPVPRSGDEWPGMSLRDYFAAAALPGICKEFYDDERFLFTSALIANEAYDIADAMLEARKK